MERNGEETPLLILLPSLQKIISLTEIHKIFGMTKSQIRILISLHYRKNMTMSEVAHNLSSAKEQATRVVSTLYEQGLVERFEDPRNRTHVYIRFSELGKQYMQKVLEELNREVSQKINASLSDEDIALLNKSVQTTVEILNKIE